MAHCWQVIELLQSVRLRRYRIPLKLIYCAGLRLSECLNLTVNDISAEKGKLWVRKGKGGKDRMVPISLVMGRTCVVAGAFIATSA